MYIYVSSADSLDAYPHNNAQNFTSNLSQILYTKSQAIGLREIVIHPVSSSDFVSANNSISDNAANTFQGKEKEVYMYVMLTQCANVEVHGHRHPIVRMLTTSEFTQNSSILRFPDVLYVPIKEYNLSHITVTIRPADIINSGCCIQSDNILKGITRCTFHIQDL
jgi:hypothetical protein